VTQGGHERRRFPVTEGRMSEQLFASFTSSMAGRHRGKSRGLADERKLLGSKTFPLIAPSDASSKARRRVEHPAFPVPRRAEFLYRSIADAAKTARRQIVPP
jgi:hypothetical protein